MAIVHPNPNSGLTPAGYCARVAFAAAVVAMGLKVTIDQLPCDMARTAACRLSALDADARAQGPATAVFLGTGNSSPLPATEGEMAAAE
jgi:hypothetical protein